MRKVHKHNKSKANYGLLTKHGINLIKLCIGISRIVTFKFRFTEIHD